MSRPRSRTSSAPLVPPPSPASALASAPPSPNDGRTRSSGSFWWWVKKGGGTDVEKTHQLRRPLKATEWARRRVSFVLLSVSLAVVGCCLGWRCLYAALSSGSGKGLNGSWRYGRYHDHITGLRPDDAAYRDLLASSGRASWAAHPAATQVRCPAFNASLLPPALWGPGRGLFVAANLRDNEGVLANFIRQVSHLAQLYGAERRLFVSMYESNSRDATPLWLQELRVELAALGVPHEIVSGGGGEEKGGGGGARGAEDRIAFLARMRNRAMAPLYEGRARAGPGQDERFGHVVFVNDVFFCAYEVLRLLMYEADLACGLDLLLEPDPGKYLRRGQPEAAEIRRELTFYDTWVARDARGRRFEWAPPFARYVGAEGEGEGAASLDTGGPVSLPEHRHAFPAFCCWNGLAALRAEPFYRGLRFRSSRPGRGVQSECTHLCLDLWVNGYTRVVVDPQVKLAYDEPTYERIQIALPPRYPDLHRVNSINNSSRSTDAPPPSLSTCFLETSPAKRGSMVRFEDCRDDFPTARALAEHAGPRLSDLCWGDEQAAAAPSAAAAAAGAAGEAAEGDTIPRALLQLAPFPLASEEAALDEAHAPPGAAAVAWHERWRLGKRAARRAEAARVLALAEGPRAWRALWDDWQRLHVDAPARLYDKDGAEAVLRRHFPLAGPVLRQLEAEGRWAQWRTLASLALLYHHGGVLVPPARYRPLRSLDCFWGGGGARAGGPLLDLQAMFPGLVEEVDGGHGAAWGPDLRLVAAPRHDEAMRRAVARLFFSDEGEKEEEEQLTARVLMLLRDGGDVR